MYQAHVATFKGKQKNFISDIGIPELGLPLLLSLWADFSEGDLKPWIKKSVDSVWRVKVRYGRILSRCWLIDPIL